MPLDAKDAIGILQGLQNLDLSQQYNARYGVQYVDSMRNLFATIYPEATDMPAAFQDVILSGVPGGQKRDLYQKLLQQPLARTPAGQEQRAKISAGRQGAVDAFATIDQAIEEARTINPALAESLERVKPAFMQTHKIFQEMQKGLYPRAAQPGSSPGPEFKTLEEQAAFPGSAVEPRGPASTVRPKVVKPSVRPGTHADLPYPSKRLTP